MSNPLHQKSTGEAASQPPTTAFGHLRQRSRQACIPCRQRKRKCDGRLPCSTCTGYGYECHYKCTNHHEDNSGNANGQRANATTNNAKRTSSTAAVDESSTQLLPAKKAVRLTEEAREGTVLLPKQQQETLNYKPPPNGILEPSKSRYMGRHSSVAFPRWLGLNLQSTTPPRLHSFAYNTGIRREPGYGVRFQLVEFIPWDEVNDSIDLYTSVIHPVFGFLDIESLRRRCRDHWHGKPQGADLEAVVCGVVGLASLFSGALSEEREMRIVLHAKEILDDSSVSRFPSIDVISGWILRTVYIRSTSRPHMAWLYSCITMHLIEAAGLHREIEGVILTTDSGKRMIQETCDIRERIATVARCLNTIISYEYGRSMVDVGPISQKNIIPRQGDLTLQLYELVRVLPPDDTNQDPLVRRLELSAALGRLFAISTDHEFLTLVKTDLCLCIYRRLRLLDLGVKQEQLEQVIAAGTAALPAARNLVARKHPWWNAIGTVFQFVCVLLAIDSSESLSVIPDAMQTLKTIAKQLNTHLAMEALNTARGLVRALTEKKRRDINILEKLSEATDNDTNLTTTNTTTANNNNNDDDDPDRQQQQQWPGPASLDMMDGDWNWDAYFQPPYSTMSPFLDMRSWL